MMGFLTVHTAITVSKGKLVCLNQGKYSQSYLHPWGLSACKPGSARLVPQASARGGLDGAIAYGLARPACSTTSVFHQLQCTQQATAPGCECVIEAYTTLTVWHALFTMTWLLPQISCKGGRVKESSQAASTLCQAATPQTY